jgi:predicted dehydrogenase
MKTIRWGVIGCGAVTDVKSLPAYQQVEGFCVEGIARRDFTKAKNCAKRHDIPRIFQDADALIDDPDIDAIYIATPPDSHADYALKTAAAGKICSIEKPMAPNYETSLQIQKAFNRAGAPLFVAYYRRSLPRFLAVKRWIDEGEIGEVRHVCWQLFRAPNEIDLSGRYNWRTDAAIAVGGYFDDIGSHGIDLITFLLGEIREVEGIACNRQKLYSALDSVTACWLHKSGATGSGSWNFGAYGREDSVTIYGSCGKITFSVLDEAPILLENSNGRSVREISNPKHIQYFHVENILKHLQGEADHPSTGSSALHTAWVMDKIVSGSL